MCEQCRARSAQNTIVKRAAMDVVFATPTSDVVAGQTVAEIPGLLEFLSLAQDMEALSRRRAGDADRPEQVLLDALKARVFALSPKQRSDVVRVAQYAAERARSIFETVGTAKVMMHDTDITSIAATVEEREIVVRVNGEVVQRIALEADQDADAALNAAEQAMQAHRDQYHAAD